MNAVERLLAHGKRALRLFGDAHSPGEWFDSRFEFMEAVAIAKEVVELVEWRGWQSLAFLRLAVWRTIDHEPPSDRPAEALRVYCELLDERRRLLSPKRLRTLLADAVRESREWGDLSRDVVQRSEAVIAALGRLRKLPGNEVPYSYQDEADARCTKCHDLLKKLRPALRGLHTFEHPPRASNRAGHRKTGRPRGVDAKTQRELAEGWLDFERRYDGDGRPTKRQYIAERCRGKRKGATEQAALEARTLRDLQTALKARNRKKAAIHAARTK